MTYILFGVIVYLIWNIWVLTRHLKVICEVENALRQDIYKKRGVIKGSKEIDEILANEIDFRLYKRYYLLLAKGYNFNIEINQGSDQIDENSLKKLFSKIERDTNDDNRKIFLDRISRFS